MAKRVDFSLAEKVKVVSELDLPGVTQASVAKKNGVSSTFYIDRRCHAFLKRIFFEISREGAIVAENERAKARRRMLGMLCFCVSNRNCRPRCACFPAALEAKSLRPARTLGMDYTHVYLTCAQLKYS